MTRVVLVNPNTDTAITTRMLAAARAVAPTGFDLAGITAERGAALITDEAQLALAAEAVMALTPRLRAFDGIIVAAFGDPSCDEMRAACGVPVVGIGVSVGAEIEAVGIAGGTRADAARCLAPERSITVIEPVPAAVRAIATRLSRPRSGYEVAAT